MTEAYIVYIITMVSKDKTVSLSFRHLSKQIEGLDIVEKEMPRMWSLLQCSVSCLIDVTSK